MDVDLISDCVGCKIYFYEALAFTEEDIVNFLIGHRIFKRVIKCIRCGNDVKLCKRKLHFRCTKQVVLPKKKRSKCNKVVSAKSGTIFSKCRLSLKHVWLIVSTYLYLRPPRHLFICSQLKISQRTVVDWCSFIRDVILDHLHRNSEKIGGPGSFVEIIDEAKFRKSKFIPAFRGCGTQWVLGGIEKKTKKTFLVSVDDDYDSASLIPLIEEWIAPGTTIVTNRWKAYKQLTQDDFDHLSVNFSINFVIKSTIRKTNLKVAYTARAVIEYLFKEKYNKLENRLHVFFKAASEFGHPNTQEL